MIIIVNKWLKKKTKPKEKNQNKKRKSEHVKIGFDYILKKS